MPRTILDQMGCRGTQSSCRFHECFGASASLDGSGPPWNQSIWGCDYQSFRFQTASSTSDPASLHERSGHLQASLGTRFYNYATRIIFHPSSERICVWSESPLAQLSMGNEDVVATGR